MKKILIITYFILAWFTCQSQEYNYNFDLISFSKTKDPLVSLDADGNFLFELPNEYGNEIVLPYNQILYLNESIELKNNDCTVIIYPSKDCMWIDKYVVFRGKELQYEYEFVITEDVIMLTRD